MMRSVFIFLALCYATLTNAQPVTAVAEVIGKLNLGNAVPKDLLSTRSVVLHDHSFSEAELHKAQEAFKEAGIDAIGYFENDVVFAGKEVARTHASYLASREVSHLIFLTKKANIIAATITAFNQKETFVDDNQPAWLVTDPSLIEVLGLIYRNALNNQEPKNFLINDQPESGFDLNFIKGRRSPFFAIDLKVDNLAVPWFQDAEMDSILVRLFKTHYPLEYGFVTPADDDKDYRRQGFHYVLGYVHTRGEAARNILGYNVSETETAITSVTYPNGELKLKTISASTPVYKFYMKHIESGNVFLGTKWDADIRWEDALRNYIKAFKAEIKIN